MDFSRAFKEIFGFFFKQELKAKRTRVFFLLSFLPILLVLIAKINEIRATYGEATSAQVFTQAVLIIYIQLLIPILALLFGSGIVNEEVDNKTLVFLTTSPIPKPSIITGKFAAYVLLGIIIVNVGLFLCFLIVNINRLGKMVHVKEFFSFVGVGILGLVTYMALFTLLGTLLKKAGVVLGLLFIFGWENLVQYFPGITQKFTVIHWIKSLLPRGFRGTVFKALMFRLEPSSTLESLVVLIIFVTAALVAASLIFKNREYILSETV
ncbi:MAG: ABC transporter permease subunit [Candidatus Aminicenantes bacterium]|nr:ABC transporter permease subunit [Candidatus Aminicenantes bacterium]NIM83363.1 ABC transporter permease subunit [Candidatus Aminicenantes bacterium]NIN22727.1 ABC transporter permease subunit [Candidatus Aminicenantes bacterium]NIN46487.1 ABC transporter permease subunit [Candidatus Aminicenantes bacterium]NIN89369.1 ABC transporter permease subunit [Candidatus Aminicenantes bacterium]